MQMGKTIYCRGKDWEVNEYNKRLGKENKIDEEADAKIEEIEKWRKEETDKVWKSEE